MSPTDECDLELVGRLRPEPAPDQAVVAHHRGQLQAAIRAAANGSPTAVRRATAGATPTLDADQEDLPSYVVPLVSRRRRGTTILVTAAAVAVLIAAVGVAGRWGRGPGYQTSTMRDPSVASASVAPAAPAGLPAPTAAPPDGLTLWGVAWGSSNDTNGVGYPGDGEWTQLFGVEGEPDAQILVEYHVPGEGQEMDVDWDDPVATVRGKDAVVTVYGDGAYGREVLAWREGDRVGLAAFRGMTVAEAADAVDTLRARPGGARGFDAPEGGPLTLLGESDGATATTGAEFTYAAGVPDASDWSESGESTPSAWVQTTPATGGISRPYLHTWFAGQRDGDGRVVSSIPQSGIVTIVWPDGRTARGETNAGVSMAALERLVASAEPATAARLTDLWSEANDRLASLPLVAGGDVGPGVLELRGEGGRPQTLCLRLAAGSACAPPGVGLSGSGTGALSGGGPAIVVGLPVGEAWYVVVAAHDGVDVTFDPEGLPVAESAIDGWDVSLAQPPDGVDDVVVDHGDTGRAVYRP